MVRPLNFCIIFVSFSVVVSFESNCHKIFYSTSGEKEGVLQSPLYPENYPNHAFCTWELMGQEGLNISVDFQEFQTAPDGDVVQIFEGTTEDNLLASLSGSLKEHKYSTGNSQMTIVFSSSNSNPAKGFLADYRIFCLERNFTETSGIFSSPNYPQEYPRNVLCSYFFDISAPAGYALAFKFPKIDMEGARMYFYNGTDGFDPFSIQDGINLLEDEELSVFAPSSQIRMDFKTGSSGYGHSGFEGSYELVCGGGFYASRYVLFPQEQEITSANYPQNYANDQNCTYLISTQNAFYSQSVLIIRILDFETEENADFVTFYDGDSVSSKQIVRLSGKLSKQAFMSSGPHMLITFSSNSENTFKSRDSK